MAGLLAWQTRRPWTADDGEPPPEERRGRERPFLTALSLILLAEWGDLSQLATVAFQARYDQALLVFTIATLALWAVTALAVTIGNRLGALLPQRPVQYVAAGLMAIIGVVLISGRIG